MRKPEKTMTAKERRDYHFAEMKRAIIELHPDLTKWSVDFTDDDAPGEFALGVLIQANRTETALIRETSKARMTALEMNHRQRLEAEAEYRKGIAARVERARLQS